MRSSWISEYSRDKNQQIGLFQAPPFIRFLSSFRPELKQYSDDSLSSRIALYLWWEQIGWREYSNVDWDLDKDSILFANDLFKEPSSFAIKYSSVVAEWLKLKKGKNSLLKEDDALLKWLYQIEVQQGEILPNFFQVLISSRLDLNNSYDLSKQSLSSIVSILDWWERYGKKEYPRMSFSSYSFLYKEHTTLIDIKSHSYLPMYLFIIYRERKDLQDTFDIESSNGYDAFLSWWDAYGKNEYSYVIGIINSLVSDDFDKYSCSGHQDGVNIIGFPQGILGLGEDARLAGKVVHDLGLEGAFINAPIAGPEKIITPEVSFPITKEIRYNTSIFCLPPTEMMRLAIEGGHDLLNTHEYKIGAWPWELPHWPTAFSKVRCFVDEIWAQSDYVKACFLKEGNTPVYKMPMAVTIPSPTKNVKETLGYCKNTFLFYLMFDGNSWLSRKNPLAGVLAFQRAFSNGRYGSDVGLVIKAMNVDRANPVWQKIESIANKDSRIRIVTDRMSRQDVINLMASCDSYISLHRSEGFGRVIAEAMLLQQPVVATNFSGNVDFCTSDTSYLVNGELIPLSPGDYIFYEGQYWCDPDLDEAARRIIDVYEDMSKREKVAIAGKEFIEKNYSMEAVSRAYSERLQNIKHI